MWGALVEGFDGPKAGFPFVFLNVKVSDVSESIARSDTS